MLYPTYRLIYSYGDDAEVVSMLKSSGFTEKEITIPARHLHRYNPEFDKSEDEVMNYFEWIEFPIQEEHDDP